MKNIKEVKNEVHKILNGVVIEKTPQSIFVFDGNSVIKVKNNNFFKEEIYIGDYVELNENYEICSYMPRKNILSRERKDETKQNNKTNTQVIACNIDLALIVVSAKTPPLHPRFIDRYSILLKKLQIPFIIIVNKCDLLTEYERKIISLYKNLGIKVIQTSTILSTGIAELKHELTGKQSIFVGNSGVGKSSLVNTLLGEDTTKVNTIGKKSKRGCHTTTSTKYYVLDEISSIIDTPGIRSLDLSGFTFNEIQHYFKEIEDFSKLCKYNNCLHIKEIDCAVKLAVKEEKITKERYESYKKVMSELQK